MSSDSLQFDSKLERDNSARGKIQRLAPGQRARVRLNFSMYSRHPRLPCLKYPRGGLEEDTGVLESLGSLGSGPVRDGYRRGSMSPIKSISSTGGLSIASPNLCSNGAIPNPIKN